MTNNEKKELTSNEPFHLGEQFIQDKLGKREIMAEIGKRFIRDHMPKQHIDFYLNLTYLFVGHLDNASNPWPAMFFNQQGLVTIPDNKTLILSTCHMRGLCKKTFKLGDEIGLLGIDLTNKRRNRLNGTIKKITPQAIHLQVKQSFGNCAKYITTKYQSPWRTPYRSVKGEAAINNATIKATDKATDKATIKATTIKHFDQAMMQLIKTSDSFFVASFYRNANHTRSSVSGVDVSYRGGTPGFIELASTNKLVIPDYAGNNFFNTLGNIEKTAKAGLLFIDDNTGSVLFMTGKADILWQKKPTTSANGAERFWRFSLTQAYWHNQALPFTFTQHNLT